MSVKTYGRTALIGGSSGALDEYDADNLNEGDRCLTILSTGEYYFHRLNATSGAAESSPDVIKPDSGGGVSPYAGDKRWILIKLGNIASIIHGVSAKTTPVDADELGLIDSAASWILKKLTWANLKATLKTYFDGLYTKYPDTGEQAFLDADHSKLNAIEASANVTDAVNVGTSIHGVANKATPVNADKVPLIDTENSNVLKTSTWINIKAFLKIYFDGIYAALAHKTRHENAGADEISVAGLSGLLADDQHVLDSEVLAAAGVNSGITSMTGLDNNGIPVAKVSGAIETATLAGAVITDHRLIRGNGGARGVQESTIIVSDNGEMTNPSQPCFQVHPTSAQTNIALSGVTVVFGTERFDVGNNFASNTFTAPVTGKYFLNCMIRLEDVDIAATYYRVQIITSNRSYQAVYDVSKFSADLTYFPLMLAIIADMDVSDTAYIEVAQSGGTVQTDINTVSFFSGALIC